MNQWNAVGTAGVYSACPEQWGLRSVNRKFLYQVLYLNSFVAARASISPLAARVLRLAGAARVVVAPTGEFSADALAVKGMNKRAYVVVARAVGLYEDHARAQTQQWARCLTADVGAQYLLEVIEAHRTGGQAPAPPWARAGAGSDALTIGVSC